MLLTFGGIAEDSLSEDWLRHYNELATFCGLDAVTNEDFVPGTGEDEGWFDYDPDNTTGLSVAPDSSGNIVCVYVSGNTGDEKVVKLLTCAVCAADDSFTFAELMTQMRIIVTECELLGRIKDVKGTLGDWYYEGFVDEDDLGPYVAVSFYCDRPVSYGDGSDTPSENEEPDAAPTPAPQPTPAPTNKIIHKA